MAIVAFVNYRGLADDRVTQGETCVRRTACASEPVLLHDATCPWTHMGAGQGGACSCGA